MFSCSVLKHLEKQSQKSHIEHHEIQFHMVLILVLVSSFPLESLSPHTRTADLPGENTAVGPNAPHRRGLTRSSQVVAFTARVINSPSQPQQTNSS